MTRGRRVLDGRGTPDQTTELIADVGAVSCSLHVPQRSVQGSVWHVSFRHRAPQTTVGRARVLRNPDQIPEHTRTHSHTHTRTHTHTHTDTHTRRMGSGLHQVTRSQQLQDVVSQCHCEMSSRIYRFWLTSERQSIELEQLEAIVLPWMAEEGDAAHAPPGMELFFSHTSMA